MNGKYWIVSEENRLKPISGTSFDGYKFRIIPVENATGINDVKSEDVIRTEYYTVGGVKTTIPTRGIFIRKSFMSDGSSKSEKIIIR